MVRETTDFLELIVRPFAITALTTTDMRHFLASAPRFTLFGRIAESDLMFVQRTRSTLRTQLALHEPGSPRSEHLYRDLLEEIAPLAEEPVDAGVQPVPFPLGAQDQS